MGCSGLGLDMLSMVFRLSNRNGADKVALLKFVERLKFIAAEDRRLWQRQTTQNAKLSEFIVLLKGK
jgi:hypothetical protein